MVSVGLFVWTQFFQSYDDDHDNDAYTLWRIHERVDEADVVTRFVQMTEISSGLVCFSE